MSEHPTNVKSENAVKEEKKIANPLTSDVKSSLYWSALETISEGVILQSSSGVILVWNKGSENILGISAERALGYRRKEQFLKLIHENGSECNFEDSPSVKTLNTGEPCTNVILGVYRKPDDLRWISINTNPVFRDNDEKPSAVAISFSDITELKIEKDTSQNYLDIAGVIIVALNDSGDITLINKKGCEILGGTEDYLIGKNWFDLFAPKEVYNEAKVFYRELMTAGERDSEYTEYKIISLSGEEKIIAWNHSYLKDKDGNVTGTLSSGEDITEKKRAEEEIKRRSEFERLISKISSEFVNLKLKDLDSGIEKALTSIGLFSDADRAYLFLFRKDEELADNTHEWCAEGIAPVIDNFQGISIKDEFPWFYSVIRKREVFEIPDVHDLPPEASAEQKLLEVGDVKSLICVPMILNGSAIGFLGLDAVKAKKKWSPEDQAILRLVGEVFTNAIDRKWAEEELHESEMRWQFALEGAEDGVWDWNAETDTVFFSKRWKEMLGFSDDEITHQFHEWDSRLHPDDRDFVYADLNAHLNGETNIFQSEYRLLCKDGSYKWILDRGKAIEWTEDGKPIRVIGTHSDISDRKKWELEREKLITELKDALDHIKTLSGLLPICSNCKKIRDDQGYWNQIETFIHNHSDARFSHGICPECAKILYPDLNIFSEDE